MSANSEIILKGALYIRVSTDKQEELSPDAQKRLLLDYALNHHIQVAPEHIFMEKGISGRKADRRPAFQEMIARAKSSDHPFDQILVWKFSRFARNQEESIVYKSMLRRQHQVEVVSITEPLMDGPFGSLIERIIEWMDEYYSINLSTEVVRGMTEKALRGGYQSSPPLGYRSPSPGSPYVVVPEEAALVQDIFRKYTQKELSPSAIAKELNSQGALTKRKKPFEERSVRYILRNRFYIGKVSWNGIERDGSHEIFLSPGLFEKAQNRLAAAQKGPKHRSLSSCKHWLSGLVKCSVCGSTLSFNQSAYPFFNCWRYTKGLHPGTSGISEKNLVAGVLAYFQTLENLSPLSLSPKHNPSEETTLTELLSSDTVSLSVKGEFVRSVVENILWDKEQNTLYFYMRNS